MRVEKNREREKERKKQMNAIKKGTARGGNNDLARKENEKKQ